MLSLDFFLCFEVLLEAVDLLEPGDAVDGKLICEPEVVGRKEPQRVDVLSFETLLGLGF